MKLIKKITYKRVQQLPQYKKILDTFEKFKEDPDIDRHNSIKRTKDASKLNYFFVIEYENIIKKKINFNNFITKDQYNNNTINLNKLIEEKEKIENYIIEKRKKEPNCFNKLGTLNQVNGVYLVAGNKKNLNNIKDLDLKYKNNIIVIKINYKNLPKEIDEICNNFYIKTQERLKKEKEEFDKFSKMNSEEQNNYINAILNDINSPQIKFIENLEIENEYYNSSGFTLYDGFSENNIKNINNTEFLNSLLNNALEKEQYELCAKIRDRLIELKD